MNARQLALWWCLASLWAAGAGLLALYHEGILP